MSKGSHRKFFELPEKPVLRYMSDCITDKQLRVTFFVACGRH